MITLIEGAAFILKFKVSISDIEINSLRLKNFKRKVLTSDEDDKHKNSNLYWYSPFETNLIIARFSDALKKV